MRGAPDIGCIKARNEVEPHGEGYRGVVTIVGQGSWHTPNAPSREGAQILLDALNAKLLPKPPVNPDVKFVNDVAAAYDRLGVNGFALAA